MLVEDTTRAREQAQQLKLAALGRLTANIAHEIRNPLAAISHAAELLREEKRSEDRERLTRIIHDNSRRLDRLVSDVLQINRRDRVSAAPLRLQPWLRGFIGEFVANEALPAERFELEARRESWIEFDREHLHQVMWNLLKNAARYARAEPKSVRVVLDGYADRVELSVIDNGPGVPAPDPGAAVRAVLHHRLQGHRARPVSRARAVRGEPRHPGLRQRRAGGPFPHPLPTGEGQHEKTRTPRARQRGRRSSWWTTSPISASCSSSP